MGKKEIRVAYNRWHRDKAAEELIQPEVVHPWHHTVARLLPDLNGASVLEIGCGRGDFSLWLAQKYPLAVITGIDFSDAAVAVALAKLSRQNVNLRFLVDDAENLSFPTATFDHVISCECLEHVPHPEKMVREMARVLKPGGHDIGFAGETPLIRNKDLTVSNKILYYLLAGLAVVASDTAGQREVAVQAPGGVFLYPSGDAPALAARLNALLGSADALSQAKSAALDAAEGTFCWERQEKALLESINRVLCPPAT